MLEFLGPLLGRMHPLLVHLPIGILVFGILLCFFPQKKKNPLLPSIRLAFLLGGIAALSAGISGFLQYQFEGFAWEDVRIHLFGGILTTLGSFGVFFHLKSLKKIQLKSKIFVLGLALVLIITGHLGGNLTHGESYFTEVLPQELQSFLGIEIQPEKGPELAEESWEEAVFYSEVVQPILNQNCKSCHNPRNKKGELDLSSMKALLAGGEDGLILTAGDAEHSELFARLILPKEDEKHMPPSGKPQPSKEEIALIESWIKSGAKDNQTLAGAGIPRKLIERFIAKNEKPFYPITDFPAISTDSLAELKSFGFFAEAVESGSGLLKVTCINFPDFQNSDWDKLAPFKNRIAYLDLSGTKISSEIINSIVELPNLTVLKLNETAISGSNLGALTALAHLKLLYMNNTTFTLREIQMLAKSQSLKKVFAFDTPAAKEWTVSEGLTFPFQLEVGNFQLPKLPTDTIVY
ncbi:c-type cytochrome domain-containing protein [Algoriphagus litoralis]|uniref:c-type cytochrome domain-containing protein n=1 Tax=Algoriphagus litoralis TaxID=2202829 RepID=UPI000DB9023D|nr:c-type cytochrome domain-containing protein [Algoriphagus litoralis]